jgi:hypothetical protein
MDTVVDRNSTMERWRLAAAHTTQNRNASISTEGVEAFYLLNGVEPRGLEPLTLTLPERVSALLLTTQSFHLGQPVRQHLRSIRP